MMNMIPSEDKNLAWNCIITQYVVKTLEHDLKAIQNSQIRIKEPYIDKIESILKQINQELSMIRKEMRKRGVKILKEEKIDDMFWQFTYLVRGYEGVFRPWTAAIRFQIKQKLMNLL